MAMQRGQVRQMALPSEAVSCGPIGGEVTVRGMDMPLMLAFAAERRRLGTPLAGEAQEHANERAAGALVPMVLHGCVVLDDGASVYSLAEWGAFGALHPDEAMDLFQRAMRLSGQNTDAEKKT
jgi:hypothetical protein